MTGLPWPSSYLSLDLRSLALWRITLGALVLWDLVLRLRDWQAFYGDSGLLGRPAVFAQDWPGAPYYLFFAGGGPATLSVLFALGAVSALALIAGYRTRLAAFVCWYFAVSLQLRNPLVIDASDELLRLLLFWAPFLPLGARWSWDARPHPEWKSLPNRYRSVATIGVFLQVALFYLFAVLLKTGEDWRVTHQAAYNALSIGQMSTALGQALLQYPRLLENLTVLVMVFELTLPLLLLMPERFRWARSGFLFLALAFHLSVSLTMDLGPFGLVLIGCLTVFVPQHWWSKAPGGRVLWREIVVLPTAYSLGRASRFLAAFVCFYILYVNIDSLEQGHKLNSWTRVVAHVLYEHQHWHLFAPQPFREDGIFRLEVVTFDGKTIDLMEQPPFLWGGVPTLESARFPNQRWRRWMQNLVQVDMPDTPAWRQATLVYLLGRWTESFPQEKVRQAALLFVERRTTPPGVPRTERRVVLASYQAKQSGYEIESHNGGPTDPTSYSDRKRGPERASTQK